jgi:hypothetical protein
MRRNADRSPRRDHCEPPDMMEPSGRPGRAGPSTAAVKATQNFSQPKLTIGLDLGDRSSWYCLLDEMGEVVSEQKLGTTWKALREFLAECRAAALRWRQGCTHQRRSGPHRGSASFHFGYDVTQLRSE